MFCKSILKDVRSPRKITIFNHNRIIQKQFISLIRQNVKYAITIKIDEHFTS